MRQTVLKVVGKGKEITLTVDMPDSAKDFQARFGRPALEFANQKALSALKFAVGAKSRSNPEMSHEEIQQFTNEWKLIPPVTDKQPGQVKKSEFTEEEWEQILAMRKKKEATGKADKH